MNSDFLCLHIIYLFREPRSIVNVAPSRERVGAYRTTHLIPLGMAQAPGLGHAGRRRIGRSSRKRSNGRPGLLRLGSARKNMPQPNIFSQFPRSPDTEQAMSWALSIQTRQIICTRMAMWQGIRYPCFTVPSGPVSLTSGQIISIR